MRVVQCSAAYIFLALLSLATPLSIKEKAPITIPVTSNGQFYYDDNEWRNFKYPKEPEISGNDVENTDDQMEEMDGAKFDLGTYGLNLYKAENESMTIYAGRARCKCGRPGDRDLPLKIINGTVVPINDLPWTVALVRKRFWSTPKGAYCGATLINNLYVLTASHCVDGVSPTSIQVWIHEEDFSSTTETPGGTQRFDVAKIIMHPKYSRRTIDNDIALIKLSRKVNLDHVVVPACLPANNDYSFEKIKATVAGWGATEEGGGTSSTLMKVTVPIISNEECNSKSRYKGKITPNMLCAGYKQGGKDSCQGDSGGPLTIYNGGRITLVGIVSFGYGCARPDSPGVYTRVARYPEWIVMNSDGADWCEV